MEEKKTSHSTLAILLLLPFIVGLLTYVGITVLRNTVSADITDIIWDYGDNEGFQVSAVKTYPLQAERVYDHNVKLADGNDLTWSLSNVEGRDETAYAEIVQDGSNFSLRALKEGNVYVICQNERGTKSKRFLANIYDEGTILINPSNPSSGSSLETLRHYGQYDLSYASLGGASEKTPARFELKTTGYFGDGSSAVSCLETSENLSFENGFVTIHGAGESYLSFALRDHSFIKSEYRFLVLPEAVNVYSYDDLLMATNLSKDGDPVCLQTNLLSLARTYAKKADGTYGQELLSPSTKLFGDFDFSKQSLSYAHQYHTFLTTYDHEFVDQWNAKASAAEQVSLSLKAGIRLRQNFYGNGFAISLHELAYPTHGLVDSSQLLTPDPEKDDFQGPLPFVTIGSPQAPLIETYGQDNVGLLLDGDGLTLDDLHLQNCDPIDNLYNLNYTGTVVEVNGKNATIANSVLSYGRTIVRAFSSDGLLIKNSLLEYGRQFLLHLGSNRYWKSEKSQDVSVPYKNDLITASFRDFFDKLDQGAYDADGILSTFVQNGLSASGTAGALTTLRAMQSYLDNWNYISADGKTASSYEDQVTLDGVKFYQSGIFSVALESMFNGPYLYKGLPSFISQKLSSYLPNGVTIPEEIAGTSAPVKLTLKGDTAFYDWKTFASVDPSSLVHNGLGGAGLSITLNDFFPMKEILYDLASAKKYVYFSAGNDYLNSAIAYYGGGLNLSSVVDERSGTKNVLGNELSADFLEDSLSNKHIDASSTLAVVLSRCVNLAMGFHPFRFLTNGAYQGVPPLFGETPTLK